jgi:vacuolar-type H+-ATPase subunit I/STV1
MGLSGNIYFALALGLLTALAGFYFYYQCKDSDTFRHLGAFLLATQVAAVIAGFLIVSRHVSPAIKAKVPRSSGAPVVEAMAPQAPPLMPPTSRWQ